MTIDNFGVGSILDVGGDGNRPVTVEEFQRIIGRMATRVIAEELEKRIRLLEDQMTQVAQILGTPAP